MKYPQKTADALKDMKLSETECGQTEIEGEVAPPCVMVIFGASGDLTKRKLVPAVYNLAKYGVLSKQFALIGIARRPLSHESFRQQLRADLGQFDCPVESEVWDGFARRLFYLSGDLNDPKTYASLADLIAGVDAKEGGVSRNILFYLAITPNYFVEVIKELNAAGILREEGGEKRRVIFEKPFGRDLESAKSLDAEIKRILAEHQIYRIDHYLGKATVQNIMAFRFANGIFEPVWDRKYIDHVQITAAETLGVEHRAGYYDHTGALRDMIPNHLFQLLTLTATECPVSFDADAMRDEQAKVLHAIQPLTHEAVLTQAVRGQYGEGFQAGEKVLAYRAEEGVNPDSQTETYVALRLMIDNWRWAGVPFYLRTGKRLANRVTEIAIQFRRPPFVLFRETSVEQLKPNRLVLSIQPNEGISLSFQAKVPGGLMKLGTVDMLFDYADYFGRTQATGYERLIYDAMCGDATLFQRADMVEAGWKVIAPIQEVWSSQRPENLPNYGAGTWGPKEADQLVAPVGGWHNPASSVVSASAHPF